MQERTEPAEHRATIWPPTAEQLILWSSVAVVVAVAVGAAVVSYRHARELVLAHGETGLTAYIGPGTVDGLIYACSMVILSAARRPGRRNFWDLMREQWLAYTGLALGIAATVGANVAHGASHGPVGAIVAAWPAVALVLSYETLMLIVRQHRPDRAAATEASEVATPCQCEQSGAEVAPVARTLLAAAVAAVRDGMSQRGAEVEFGVSRKKLSTALNQPAPLGDEVAQINGVEILEPA